jgi:hypothetical protein
MNGYPQTLDDWKAWLAEIEAKLAAQGRVVDDRLLTRKREVERVIATWDD